jgi:pilus assembly protein CpaC
MRLALAAYAVLGLAAASFAPARAADLGTGDDVVGHSIVVAKDKSAAFRLDYPFGEIVVAQPDTLQLVATTDHSFYIRGRALGSTNLLIYDQHHHLAQVIDVRVGQDIEGVEGDIAAALPGEHITVRNFAGGILLSGNATSTAAAEHAVAIAERYAPKGVTSTIAVANNQQIMVEVRFMEANRASLKDLGFNFQAALGNGSFAINSGTGLAGNQAPQTTISASGHWGPLNIDAQLDALEQKGVVRTLAKPDLMAMSGEEASFLAGGQVPYPVPNGNNGVTINFQEYGVKLRVTPTIEDDGEIKLKVAPEVSELDQANAVQISGFSMPALLETNASTTVELKDGQSFAIAGLFQQEYANTLHGVPGVSNLPVIGALFRSANWQTKRTELIIIVTPRLTAPSANPDDLPNPLRETHEPNPIDIILEGVDQKDGPPPPTRGS